MYISDLKVLSYIIQADIIHNNCITVPLKRSGGDRVSWTLSRGWNTEWVSPAPVEHVTCHVTCIVHVHKSRHFCGNYISQKSYTCAIYITNFS